MADIRKVKLTVDLEIDADVWELNYGTKDGIIGDAVDNTREMLTTWIELTGNRGTVRSVKAV
jgi:hypothetical protein